MGNVLYIFKSHFQIKYRHHLVIYSNAFELEIQSAVSDIEGLLFYSVNVTVLGHTQPTFYELAYNIHCPAL